MASAARLALRLLGAASCVVGQQLGEQPRKMQRRAMESEIPWQTAFLGSAGVNRGTGRPAAPRVAIERTAAIPVIVLKLARSGSSWFSSLHSRRPRPRPRWDFDRSEAPPSLPRTAAAQDQRGARLLLVRPRPAREAARSTGAAATCRCEEIMTSRSGDARAMASPDLLAYLIKALKTPMGMIGSGPANYSEDGKGRYCRARRCLDVIGFTINPHGARGINFTELGAAVPAARVVVFTRSNRVKAAVSRVRGRALNAACGYNNIPTGGAREAVAEKRARADPRGNWTGSACKLRDDVPVDVKVLKAALVRNYASEWVVLQTAYRDLAPRDVYEITYEDLLGDQDAALGALFRWLGKEWEAAAAGPAKYVKATGEDLRATLVNYDEIDAFLRLEAPCLEPQLEETRRNISFDRSCADPFQNASETARPRRTLE